MYFLEKWPNDMPDNGHWKDKLDSVLKLCGKKVVGAKRSANNDLKFLRNDAVELVLAINTKFKMHFE